MGIRSSSILRSEPLYHARLRARPANPCIENAFLDSGHVEVGYITLGNVAQKDLEGTANIRCEVRGLRRTTIPTPFFSLKLALIYVWIYV